ncbi:benzoate/H(+) symporter BenE family transporter [Actinomadura scrupuli]|uniref:benzoate/H(+) symporter BenE family transporter n=1 Tax=Actinomadura scrupuli TaxID=559629 RepID=UPI003D98D5BE
MSGERPPGAVQPVLAGVVTSIVGFASSFAVVLAGLRAVGASQDQAASGLLVLCVTMGVTAIVLGLWWRMPVSIAWSTPGAALLVSAGRHGGGYREALGAFLVTGLLIVLAGMSGLLGRWLHAIPVPLAGAMLAGVLLPLCLAPVQAVVRFPAQAVPVVLTWLVLNRLSRRWAVPAALAVAIAAITLSGPWTAHVSRFWPVLTVQAPAFSAGTFVGIAVPLFIVTMASQNVPGMSVLAGYGYRPALRPILLSTGAATMIGAPFGGHAVNLAAITAALVAGPDAHPDPRRRWIASVTAGGCYLGLGLSAGVAVSLIASAPPLIVEAVAGLALLGALGSAVQAAVADPGQRDAAIITLVVSASGIAPFGIGAAFWGLLAGLGFRALYRRPASPAPGPATSPPAEPSTGPAPEHPAAVPAEIPAETAAGERAGLRPAGLDTGAPGRGDA